MNKAEILKKLVAAKMSHLLWRSYAQALISGVRIDKEKVPVAHTECDFGKWYYGDGQLLSSIPSFQAIEEPHIKLHADYMQICKDLYDEFPESQDDVDKLDTMEIVMDPGFMEQAEKNENINKIIDASALMQEALDHLKEDIENMDNGDVESF